jgi:hypothetical protein
VPKQQRIAVGIASAANMTRAAREAQLYAKFRDIFGAKIGEWGLEYFIHSVILDQ